MLLVQAQRLAAVVAGVRLVVVVAAAAGLVLVLALLAVGLAQRPGRLHHHHRRAHSLGGPSIARRSKATSEGCP